MEQRDRELLTRLQRGIPIEEEPFKALSEEIKLPPEKIIDKIKLLKKNKIIRKFGTIYDGEKIGYRRALIALKVIPQHLDSVTEEINSHPAVSHNYLREGEFNVWFTLSLPPDSKLGIEKTVQFLTSHSAVIDRAILYSKKTYKIGVKLDLNSDISSRVEGFPPSQPTSKKDGGKEDSTDKKIPSKLREKRENKAEDLTKYSNPTVHQMAPKFSELEIEIIRRTQGSLPLIERPFDSWAEELKLIPSELINYLKNFESKGILRRIAAVLYHRRAGFKANALAAWDVPENRTDSTGYFLAGYKSISHCYLREKAPNWPYNLYTMIHAQSRDDLLSFISQLQTELQLSPPALLFSVKELKKRSTPYFSEEITRWEERVLASIEKNSH